jgi:hypothetical protein
LSASTQTSSPGGQSPTPGQEKPEDDLSGTWAGTWANTTPDHSTGTFEIDWEQSVLSLEGTISISGTPCLTGGSISGAIDGQHISFGVVQGQVDVSYEGSVSDDGSEMSGTYSTDCGNARGSWKATKTA